MAYVTLRPSIDLKKTDTDLLAALYGLDIEPNVQYVYTIDDEELALLILKHESFHDLVEIVK